MGLSSLILGLCLTCRSWELGTEGSDPAEVSIVLAEPAGGLVGSLTLREQGPRVPREP